MISFIEAKEIVWNSIKNNWDIQGDEPILLEDLTLEKSFGWIFFYSSTLWVQTEDMKYAVAGNSPLFVSRDSGEIKTYPTGLTLEQMIQKHEQINS